MFTTPAEVAAAPFTPSVRRWILECMDPALLSEALALEEAKEHPVPKKVQALRLQRDLKKATLSVEVSEHVEVARQAMIAESAVLEGIRSELHAESAALVEARAAVSAEHVAVAAERAKLLEEPTTEPTAVLDEEPVEPGPVNLASTFLRALSSGNAVLVTVMLEQVRIDRAPSPVLAAALCQSFTRTYRPRQRDQARRDDSRRSRSKSAVP